MIKVLFHYCVVVFAIVESCPSGTGKGRQMPNSTPYPGAEPDRGSGGYEGPGSENPHLGGPGSGTFRPPFVGPVPVFPGPTDQGLQPPFPFTEIKIHHKTKT